MKKQITKEEIILKCTQNNVKFIHLQFTDLTGTMKNLSVPFGQLNKVLNNEIMFDGSSIDGFARIEESDMYLRADLSTFCIYPWITDDAKEARLICDTFNPDGTPFEGCPRNILKKSLLEAEELGYTMYVGPECEFYLFKTDQHGRPTLETNDNAGYFDLAPVDLGEEARKDMVLTLMEMGFEIEASHHECGTGQHEIDFMYSDALSAADNIMTFKMVVRKIAQKHGLHATFMAKPVFGIPGSGMHLNQSLFIGGKNIFFDEDTSDQLSEQAYEYIAGLLKHAKGITAITNPTVNSYKRLVPEFEAPVFIAWSHKNRSPLIRIPAKRGKSTRLELRSPDPSANPYLALALNLKAGLDGIKNKLTPPPAIASNLYQLTPDQKFMNHIEILPQTLLEALDELKKDELLMGALGTHAQKQYIAAKMHEWNEYRIQVTDWEIKNYLTKI